MATMALSPRVLPKAPTTLRSPSLRLAQWQSRRFASAATAAGTEHSDLDTFTPQQHQKQRQNRQESIRQAKPFSEFLTDNFDRQHDYLRISLTERCNLRCLYCMPEEGIQLSPNREILTTAEIHYLSALFVNQGVNKIRLTGGEPTVRKDIIPLMQQIGSLRRNGLKELALTTNGISLHRKLDDMVEAGLTGVNISLDTLDPFQFQLLTRRQGFSAVMKSIDRVKEMNKLGAGVKLKINCVVMRGLNDHQVLPFVDMTQDQDIEVRFIEYMPFGGNKWSENKMMSYSDMLDAIREKYPSIARLKDAKNDTSKTWQVPGFVGRVGFITSMTHNFCGSCNRLRITSDGNLKVCLHGETEVSLRDLLRKDHGGEPMDEEAFEAIRQLELSRKEDGKLRFDGEEGWMSKEQQLLDVIGAAVKRKKAKHAGMGQLENMKNRPMILIASGEAHMVDVGAKQSTKRTAIAVAHVRLQQHTYEQILENNNKKGDVLGIARIAGIMAAKRTPDIIPLCHPLAISKAEVDAYLIPPDRQSHFFNNNEHGQPIVAIQARVECVGPTGVEMEALTAVQGAALTVFDMCKAVDKELVIEGARVVYKAGGRSGVTVDEMWKEEVGVEKFEPETGELLKG